MIKITPFVLFFIILIVLVISVIYGNIYGQLEGFIANRNDITTNSNIIIPQYSRNPNKPVTKLYDNLYFDEKNGNLIEIDSASMGNVTTGNASIGSAITKLTVVTRNRDGYIYTPTITGTALIEQDVDESKITKVVESFRSMAYLSKSENTDKYTLFYMPWVDSTYIHLIDNNKSANIGSWQFKYQVGGIYKQYSANTPVGLTQYLSIKDENDNKMVQDLYYGSSRDLFQLSKYVKFDIATANLIIQSGDNANKSITVYDRSKTPTVISTSTGTTTFNTTIPSTEFIPYTVLDLCGQNMVLYMPSSKKTVVAIISYKDTNKNSYDLVNVCRFTEYGLDRNNQTEHNYDDYTKGDNDDEDDYRYSGRSGRNGRDDRNRNDYGGMFNYSDDYMLKTQIVPPVCPTCPSCPQTAAVCTNCGGCGGSGTLSNNGQSTVMPGNNIVNTAGNIVTGAENVLGKTVSAAGNIATKTVDATGNIVIGAGNVAGNTVNAAGNIVSSTIGAAGNVVGGAIQETGSLIRGAGSGATSLLRDTGSGIKDILTAGQSNSQMNEPRQTGGQSTNLGTNNQYSDQYSYYGQLPAKNPSVFMPVTTDFSAFAK